MPLNFYKHAGKGNQLVKELAVELGHKKDTERAGRILRAVLITLRSQLTLQENFQLLSQLPMVLKAVYVSGWSPAKKSKRKIRKKDDFINEVIIADGNAARKDFNHSARGIKAVKAVFRTLQNHITFGEFEDIKAVLPDEIKEMITESIAEKKTSKTKK